MNTIKKLCGIGIPILILLAISNFILLSCSEDELPLEYKIVFQNNYFQTVTAKIDTFTSNNLNPKEISTPIFIPKGVYPIHCRTKSNLLIKSELNLKGKMKQIEVILSEKGKIIL